MTIYILLMSWAFLNTNMRSQKTMALNLFIVLTLCNFFEVCIVECPICPWNLGDAQTRGKVAFSCGIFRLPSLLLWQKPPTTFGRSAIFGFRSGCIVVCVKIWCLKFASGCFFELDLEAKEGCSRMMVLIGEFWFLTAFWKLSYTICKYFFYCFNKCLELVLELKCVVQLKTSVSVI